MTDSFADALKNIDPKVREQAMQNLPGIQKSMMGVLGKHMLGKATYEKKNFVSIDEVMDFICNDTNITIVAILPDFRTYSYFVIYERLGD